MSESPFPPHPAAYIEGLPAEILGRIFLLISRDVRFTSLFDLAVLADPLYRSTLRPPLRISHVNQRWREISLSIGELWSRLCIDLSKDTALAFSRSAVQVFDTFLERTNGVPLNCGFICDIDIDDYSDLHPTGEYIITTLLKEQRRWKDVHFRWISLRFSDDFRGIEICDTPILTSLSIEASFNAKQGTDNVQVDISKTSRLRDLCLKGNFTLDVGEERLPTFRTCTLHFGRATENMKKASTCMNVLNVAPNLRKFTFGSELFSELFGDDRALLDYVPRESEITLDITELGLLSERCASFVIQHLHLPKLVRLEYRNHSEPSMEALLRFIQRSRPPLGYLLVTSTINESTLMQILSLLPTLIRLDLIGANLSVRFFRALDPGQETKSSLDAKQEVICPRLRTLILNRINMEGDFDECIDALCSTMKSLHDGPRSFKAIRFGYSSFSDLVVLNDSERAVIAESLRSLLGGITLGVTPNDVLNPFSWESYL